MRLSCGAELECSQTEFYNTGRAYVTEGREHGRRQLQALVRLRTDDRGSGPIPALVFPSPRHRGPNEAAQAYWAGWTAARNLISGAAPRTQRDLHLDSALESNRTGPTNACSDEELTTAVFTTELVCGFLRSLTDGA